MLLPDGFHRDGHHISAAVTLGSVHLDWHCPGPALCEALGEARGEQGECWVCQMATDDEEWMERQAKPADGWPTVELPCEIEWAAQGVGEDVELYWRPVEPVLLTSVTLGMVVVKLGSLDDDSPWRMTLDVMEADGRLLRHQVTGRHYNGWPDGAPERTLEDIAHVQGGAAQEREALAAELDRLDRRYGAAIRFHVNRLYRDQLRAIYGPAFTGQMTLPDQEST